MRVLLFVQNGDGQPKCASPATMDRPALAPTWECAKLNNDGGDGNWWWFYRGAVLKMLRADRWWLVECENAEDGRVVIMQERVLPEGIVSTLGRVLASGGKP